MDIVCPSCRTPIAAADISRMTGLARCRMCGSQVSLFTPPAPATAPPRRWAPPAGTPRNVVMSERGGELTIAWRWYSPKYVVTAVFCVIWFALLAGVYGIAIANRNPYLLVLPIVHVVLGALMAYGTLGGFLNTTTIRIDGSRLSVRHRPLPWPGNAEYSIAQVQQLFCQQMITRRRSGIYQSYSLHALMYDGTRRTIIDGADTPDLPLFLEQHAEAWMKIPDARVPGEMVQQ